MDTSKLSDNTQDNLDKLAEIKKSNPSATHVYMRRCDKDNMVVDIPMDQAEFTIRMRKFWKLEASNKQMDDAVEALFKEPDPDMENYNTIVTESVSSLTDATGGVLPSPVINGDSFEIPLKPSEEPKKVARRRNVSPKKAKAKKAKRAKK